VRAWWNRKQTAIDDTRKDIRALQDDIRMLRRNLAVVHGQSRATLTFAAMVAGNMLQRSSMSKVLKQHVAGSVSDRQNPRTLGIPEDEQKYRDTYSATLQVIINLLDQPRQKDKKLESALEELQKTLDAFKDEQTEDDHDGTLD